MRQVVTAEDRRLVVGAEGGSIAIHDGTDCSTVGEVYETSTGTR